jgi:hypothetical protein
MGSSESCWLAAQGNLATVAKVVPQSAIQMSVYDTAKDAMMAASGSAGNELTHTQKIVAGEQNGAGR